MNGPVILPHGDTSFRVECGGVVGLVEYVGGPLHVFVEQPGRSVVVGSDMFLALLYYPSARHYERFDNTVTDVEFANAMSVLEVFLSADESVGRINFARHVLVGQKLSEAHAAAAKRAALLDRLNELQCGANRFLDALEAAVGDPSVPLPAFDDYQQ